VVDDRRISLVGRGLTKNYGPVRALDGVDFEGHGGEVHGLLGANGAGKSTVVKILAGLTAPDSGYFDIAGQQLRRATVDDSFAAGVRVAHQELAVVPILTVAEHLLLGSRVARRARDQYLTSCGDLLRDWGVAVSPSTLMRDLPPPLQACVVLARTLEEKGRVLVLDEPTAALGPREVDGLFRTLRDRVRDGALVIFVSHRLREVVDLCTNVTIMRNGKCVHSSSMAGMDERALEDLVTGASDRTARLNVISSETADASVEVGATDPGERASAKLPARGIGRSGRSTPILTVDGLRLADRVMDVSFELFPGEILGLAGLVGAGRTEVLQAIMGLRRPVGGSMSLGGKTYEPGSPHEAMGQGIALVPEERAAQAIFSAQDVGFNLESARWRTEARGWHGWRAAHDVYDRTSRMTVDRLRIKAQSLRSAIGSLSGGNQQKVVLGRFMLPGLRVLLLDEPTRGVDVEARREFQHLIRQLAGEGLAIIYVSSELAELGVCDRIVVIVRGQTTAVTIPGPLLDEPALTALCFRPRIPVSVDVRSA
jgi:ABC-type sugar transport system ATPase subunit